MNNKNTITRGSIESLTFLEHSSKIDPEYLNPSVKNRTIESA